jgi:putative proteasome-type protease
MLRRDALAIGFRHRVDVDDDYFGSIRRGWGEGLRRVFNELPRPDWLRF